MKKIINEPDAFVDEIIEAPAYRASGVDQGATADKRALVRQTRRKRGAWAS